MKIDNEFTVGVPIDRAWEALTDLEGIAPCMPGAQLTGVDGDVYSGKVKVKVGPVISQYTGTARLVEKDDTAHRARISAKGKDSRGAGNASARIDAVLRAEGGTTVVTVATDLNITGKIAQFGSGMIKEVSVKLLDQFVENLEARLHEPAAPEPEGVPEPVAEPEPVREAVPTTAPAAPVTVPAQAAPVPAETAPAPRRPVEEAEPLDLMGLAGGSVYKRLAPVAVAAVVAALIVYYVVRR
ncbi:SRPBCC family protein [Streptomyces sp. GMY02]|uniref:SRPBCC family protein n=1 Tax=Streptomyces sp. GMY02 TaxID=1333528 RepID=UPI001C2BC9E6|nr:SRPBCC family protein [Streptomyces sp. GMY02]QXE37050.1 SRPBCC family protein [Streptomyces sp. GMY02]